MIEKPLPVVHVTAEEAATLADYQAFLKARGLERTLICTRCQQQADPGTGQLGWKCGCRVLAWRVN